MTHETEIEVGNMHLCIEIDFYRTRCIPGTRFDAPEGGEIYINSVQVTKVSGATYDLDASEISLQRLDILDDAAYNVVLDNPDIYDELHDVADNWRDYV